MLQGQADTTEHRRFPEAMARCLSGAALLFFVRAFRSESP